MEFVSHDLKKNHKAWSALSAATLSECDYADATQVVLLAICHDPEAAIYADQSLMEVLPLSPFLHAEP